ncbi:MAG: endonuclease MutS2, partial [Muribaculaceae bacterium]|nr:endonuclease MutS2 [Muribaculaceae bacterium]
MIYPSDIEVKLGFDSVRDYILSLCNSQMGREEVKGMSFNSDFNHIVRSLSETNEMVGLIRRGIHTPVESVVDIIDELNRIKVPGSYLKGETYNKVNKMIDTMREVRSFFSDSKEEDTGKEFPFLSEVVEPLEAFPEISNEISRVINKFGEVKDSASPKLVEIRREKSQASGSVSRVMNRILASAISEGIVESGVTPAVRDGRIVIPVPAGLKRKIPGIVHDESATGKTVFIEPSQVVEVANKVRELEMEEQREVIAILVALADFMRPHIDEIASSTRILGYLDFVCAKAKYAEIVDAAMPVIEKVTEIEYYHAIHPVLLLNLRKQNREVVPLDICLNQKDRLLVISGPNAGGKSVCLKTVGIVQYMTQCGVLPTVYSNSHIGVFKSMFIDIGDQQSMENDLSTYSSHLRNMKYFISNATNRTLILADEIGSGTEPQIGGAIAQAILHRLSVSGCLGIVTTHYQNLKTFAEETEGMLNAAMLYDRQQLRPLFQLSVGSPGSSFAIEIARNIGLPSDVLDEAKEIVGSDYVNMDKYLLDISRDKRYWANKRQNIREKEAKLVSLLEK